jgi:hypothetical protein
MPLVYVLLLVAATPDGLVVAPEAPRPNSVGQDGKVANAGPAGVRNEYNPSQDSQSAKPIAKNPQEMRAAVHKNLRAAATESGAAKNDAIRGLTTLFVELSHDTQMGEEERLTLGRTIRARLVKVKEQIEKGAKARPATKAVAESAGSNSSPNQLTSSYDYQRPTARGGAAGPDDDGQALVDLIQKTIAPETWDLTGGLGTIRYFSPLQVIVVRQTAETHDQLQGVLQGLRN